jgi:hypothetical protein
LVQILYAQLNREGDEDSQKKMRTRVEKLEAEIADFNEKLVKERNLQRNKANAYYRKVETENMRQHLQDEKKYFKENTKHATNDEKRLADLNAEMEATNNTTRKRELKIEIKVLETDLAGQK